MSGAAVFIKSGEQPRLFNFGRPDNLVTSVTTNLTSQPLYKESPWSTFQLILQGTGAITATGTVQCSNDDNTGRGFVGGSSNDRGFAVTTTAASATLVSPARAFTAAVVGATIVMSNVAAGTTVLAVAAGGGSLTMSANASTTDATGSLQALLYGVAWCTTALGTITLSSVGASSDGFTTMAPWRYVRIVLSNVTGTVSGVQAVMGC